MAQWRVLPKWRGGHEADDSGSRGESRSVYLVLEGGALLRFAPLCSSPTTLSLQPVTKEEPQKEKAQCKNRASGHPLVLRATEPNPPTVDPDFFFFYIFLVLLFPPFLLSSVRFCARCDTGVRSESRRTGAAGWSATRDTVSRKLVSSEGKLCIGLQPRLSPRWVSFAEFAAACGSVFRRRGADGASSCGGIDECVLFNRACSWWMRLKWLLLSTRLSMCCLDMLMISFFGS